MDLLKCKKVQDQFFYRISNMDFTLEDLKHGILRGNKKSPNACFFRQFKDDDERSMVVKTNDKRILFLFMEDNEIPKKVTPFTGDHLEKELDDFCLDYCLKEIVFEPNEKELIIPKKFQTYFSDFGSKKNLVKFVSNLY